MTTTYRCKCIDSKGAIRTLEKTASSPRELSRELRREGFKLINFTITRTKKVKRLPLALVLEFTQSLELLFNQNLMLNDAIKVLGSINESTALTPLISSLSASLANGQSMSAALSDHAKSFPALYLGLLRVGEMTGTLKSVLPQLSQYLRGRKRMNEKLLGSLLYPLLILIVLIVGMIMISSFVLPTFIGVADSLSREGTHDIKRNLLLFQIAFVSVLLLVPLAIMAIFLARRDPNIRLRLDKRLLSAPPINRFFLPMEMQSVCFGIEILLKSGYTIEVAVGEAVQVTGNSALAQALKEVQGKAKKGLRLSTAFREAMIFPTTFCTWISVGEEAHDLRNVFTHLREYYEYEFEKLMQFIISIIEPAMILFVGGIIFIVISQFLGPIFRLLGGAA